MSQKDLEKLSIFHCKKFKRNQIEWILKQLSPREKGAIDAADMVALIEKLPKEDRSPVLELVFPTFDEKSKKKLFKELDIDLILDLISLHAECIPYITYINRICILNRAVSINHINALKVILNNISYAYTEINEKIRSCMSEKGKQDVISLLLRSKSLTALDVLTTNKIISECAKRDWPYIPLFLEYGCEKMDIKLLHLLYQSCSRYQHSFDLLSPKFSKKELEYLPFLSLVDFKQIVKDIPPSSLYLSLATDDIIRFSEGHLGCIIEHLGLTDDKIAKLVDHCIKNPSKALYISSKLKDNKLRMEKDILIIRENIEIFKSEKYYYDSHYDYYKNVMLEKLKIYLFEDSQELFNVVLRYELLIPIIMNSFSSYVNLLIRTGNISILFLIYKSYESYSFKTFKSIFNNLSEWNMNKILLRDKGLLLCLLAEKNPHKTEYLNYLLDKYEEFHLLEQAQKDEILIPFFGKLPEGSLLLRVYELITDKKKLLVNTDKASKLICILESDSIKLGDLAPEVREGIFKKRYQEGSLFNSIRANNLFVFKKIVPFLTVVQLKEYAKELSNVAISYFVGLDKKYLPLVTDENKKAILIIALEKTNIDGFLHILSQHILSEIDATILIDKYFQKKLPLSFIVGLLSLISRYNNKVQEGRIIRFLIENNCQKDIIEFMSEKLGGDNALEYFEHYRKNKDLSDLIFMASSEKIQQHVSKLYFNFDRQQKLDLLPFWSVQDIIGIANSIGENARKIRMNRNVTFDGNSDTLHNHIKRNISELIDKVKSNPEVSDYLSSQLHSFMHLITAEDIASATPKVKSLLVSYLPYMPPSKMKVFIPLLDTHKLNAILSYKHIVMQSTCLQMASRSQKESFLEVVGLKNAALTNWKTSKEILNWKLKILSATYDAEEHQALEKVFRYDSRLINSEVNEMANLRKMKRALIDAGETSEKIKVALKKFKNDFKTALAEARAMREVLNKLDKDKEPIEFKDPFTCIRMQNPVTITDDLGVTFVVDESTVPLLNRQNPSNRTPFQTCNIEENEELKQRIQQWVEEHPEHSSLQ